MSKIEGQDGKNTILESWDLSQFSSIFKPESLNVNRFLVSITYPNSTSPLFGYLDLEPLIHNSGGLYLPLRLQEQHPLFHVSQTNVAAIDSMNAHTDKAMKISEIVKKPQVDSHDLVDIYQCLGFAVTHDHANGFHPDSVHGVTLNFDGFATGDINLWMYKFRSPFADEIPFSARFEPKNPLWRESAQKFTETLNHSLPFVVHPASLQQLSR